MAERKSINKYYPPDWDPSKVPKIKKKPSQRLKVRLMAPFSMRCLKCNEYISASRKFNATKESTGESYMTVRIFKFTILCPICNNSIVFKTHPQSAGFTMESGAKRNFEPKNKPVPINETSDEALERLLREAKEDEDFKEVQKQRKNNKFASSRPVGNGDKTDHLEAKLMEQQKQQEVDDHLEYLQAKSLKLQSINIDHVKEKLYDDDKLLSAFNKYQSERGSHQSSLINNYDNSKTMKILKPKLILKKSPIPNALDLGYSSDE